MKTTTAMTVAATALLLSSGGAVAASPDTAAPADPYGYPDFYGIPSLGTETVSGTGCGGDGSLGETIPDGYWRGYVTAPPDTDAATLEFDVTCVYTGEVDPALVEDWTAANPDAPEPRVSDGFLVNNDAQTRSVPLGPEFFSHGTTRAADGTCPFAQPSEIPLDRNHDVWLHIVDGQAQWAVSSCEGPARAAPPELAAFVFPYEAFWDVPQLGDEPVHGTGCGGNGLVGETIPDGYWFGNITSLEDTQMALDLACMYIGDTAAQLWAEWQAENPTGGSPPYWEGTGFLVNDNERTRNVPLAEGFVQADATMAMPEGGCVAPSNPAVHQLPSPVLSVGSWVYIENGEAQWSLTECPHD